MKLSELQTRSWPLRTEGAVTDLLNSRPDALDCYHPVPRPLCLGGSGRRILGLDRRGDVENVISLDPSLGALYLEGVIDRFDVYADRSEMLCGDAGDVREVSHCGDYLVCRRADATLYFLRWSEAERDYTPIGEMPTALDFSVERVPAGTMSFAIPATEWGVKAADLRSSIPDQARRRTADAVRRAWADAVDSATRAGYLLQPTTVRVMARLWDSSVFCVSESVRVPGADWQGYDRFLLPVAFDSDGNGTGISGGTFTLEPYRVKVTLGALEQPLWNDVFRCVELYAEPERSPLSAGECSVTYAVANRAMAVYMPTHPRREMEGWLGSGPWRLALSSPLPAGELEFGRPEGKTLDELPTQAPLTGEADVMLGHGAFLHIARGSRLVTTEAGNPLAAVSSTSFGSRIKALAAMPGAGGAYTRQYIYVCTESAIFALTCDALGRHTNCRPVSPQTLTDPARILSADDAVYALCDSGALLRLRSARADTLFRGLPLFGALQWDATANELWLMQCAEAPRCAGASEDEAPTDVVLQLGAPWLAYRRDVRAACAVPQCGRVLFADAAGTLCQARSYLGYDAFADRAEQARLRMVADAPGSRWLGLRGAAMAPAAFDITVRAENETLMLSTASIGADTADSALHHVAGTTTEWDHYGRRHFLLPVVMPCTAPTAISPSRVELTLAGRWNTLETPVLLPLANRK